MEKELCSPSTYKRTLMTGTMRAKETVSLLPLPLKLKSFLMMKALSGDHVRNYFASNVKRGFNIGILCGCTYIN